MFESPSSGSWTHARSPQDHPVSTNHCVLHPLPLRTSDSFFLFPPWALMGPCLSFTVSRKPQNCFGLKPYPRPMSFQPLIPPLTPAQRLWRPCLLDQLLTDTQLTLFIGGSSLMDRYARRLLQWLPPLKHLKQPSPTGGPFTTGLIHHYYYSTPDSQRPTS